MYFPFRELGADESLFARLDSPNNTVKLTKQYRMNKSIMHLANKLTYNDTLEAGSTSIENATFIAVHSEVSLIVTIVLNNLPTGYNYCLESSETRKMDTENIIPKYKRFCNYIKYRLYP